MTAPALMLRVYGLPAPQGSKRSYGRGRMVESSKYVKPWREAVKAAAREELDQRPDWDRLDGALRLHVVFSFDRPRSHFGTGRNARRLKPLAPSAPAGPPDLSKLVRSTEDALTDAGVWRDDSRVTTISASKTYVDSGLDALAIPGAVIRVYQLGATGTAEAA